MNIDRLPPHDIPMEMGVLGCCLLDPNQCINECLIKFESVDLFYDLRHQTIYQALSVMFNARQPIDLITVQQHLKDESLLDQIGGIAYLSQLQDAVPSAANLSYYLDKVREKHLLRKLISTCSGIVGKVFDYEGNAEALLDEVEKEVLRIRPTSTQSNGINALLQEATNMIEQRAGDWDLVLGLKTGLSDLDRMTDGMHGGEFIVIAAPTSCGKTSLALNVVVHNVLDGVSSGFFSAEMKPVRLALRSLCSESRVNFKKITEGDMPTLIHNISRLNKAPIHLDSINGMTINQVRAKARRLKQQHNIKLIGIENIQLIRGEGKNREQEIADVSKGLKQMALELDIPVIGLSQVNDEGKLRESRAIGHDADTVWILENDGDWQPKIQTMVLNVEKCRDGETGTIKLIFRKEFTRFEQASKAHP